MQALPALTSQRRNVGPIETEEIAGGAKVGQRMPFFEFGIDAHEHLASICLVGFRRMANHSDRDAKFLKPCFLAARNLQGAAERTPRFDTSSEAEENFAAKAMYGGQRLFFATCLRHGLGLVEQRHGMAGIAEFLVGRAQASELERSKLTTLPSRCGRNCGLHCVDSGSRVALPNLERTASKAGQIFEKCERMFLAVSNRFIGVSNGLLQRRSVDRHEHASHKGCCNGHRVRTFPRQRDRLQHRCI